MLPRLWTLIRYGIAAKLYLLTAISIVALAVLATASIHFANQTKFAASRVYQEGVVGIQKVSELEVLFEQHRALITAAPAELDRGRLQKIRQAVEAVNARIEAGIRPESPQQAAVDGELLSQIAVEIPKLTVAGDRVLMLAYNFAQDNALEVSQGDYSQSADKIQKTLKGRYQQQLSAVDREASELSKAANDLTLWVIAAALTAFVLIGPVTLWAEHRILSRLGKMTAVMHRLCDKELAVDVPFTKASDEIGDIARSIDVFKRNAIALDLAHVQLDAALNNMAQGLCMFDAAERLVVCNERYLQMFNLSREVVKPGVPLLQLINHRAESGSFEGDPKQYLARLRDDIAIGETTRQSIETHDGRKIHIVTRPMADGGWVATHEDVTDKMRAQELFEKQELQLDTALENMSQGLCMFDASQRLIVCNKQYAILYGLNSTQTQPGTTLRAILQHRVAVGSAPEDYESYIKDRLDEVSVNKPYQIVNRLRDGRYVSVVHRPMTDGGWVATHEDVSEARRQEASFRLLFNNNPVPMYVFDRDSLRFLAVNEAAVAHYGYSHEQFLAMTQLDIRPPEERERAAKFLHRIKVVNNGEMIRVHQKSDGTKINVAIYARALSYEGHAAVLVASIDITQAKLAEDELRRTKMFLDTVIEHVPMPVVVKTAKEGRFTLLNKAGEEFFGFGRDLVIGKTPRDVFEKERADRIVAQDSEALSSGHPLFVQDHAVPTPDQGVRLVTAKKVAIQGDDGKPEYLLTLLDDVTERRQAEKRIAHMAHSDSLTDLPNRAAFNECLAATLKLAEAEVRSFAILCIDLDDFKQANDVYGHTVGDLLLCSVADRLRAVADGVFVARLGGDEFTIIADNEDRASTAKLTDRLLAAFADDFDVGDHRLRQELSIGVAIYPVDGTDAKMLMNNADAALYRAKTEDSGSVIFFEAEMSARLRERAALQTDLRSAIERNELQLAYQPQLKMTGEVTAFEALTRWHSPTRGMVPPADFIPLAEESSLILLLGEWVLREACREAASWNKPLRVAINISPVQFRHGDLPRLVHSVLLETGLAPGRLELEITEGVLIDDFSRAVSILRRLKSLGVQIALDDFGTGYSSLSYLHSFPFDKIKIDRAFISGLETNRHSIAIVRAVIGLSRSLNIPILAEGVETQAQHTFLAQEGCDEVQGYLTGRPMEIANYANVVGRKMIATTYLQVG